MDTPTYFYDTAVQWDGKRRGTLGSPGLPDLAVTTPPEFKGEPGLWTPEHLFVATAEICLMATFIGIAELSKLAVLSYRSTARGCLQRPPGKALHFTEIVIIPTIEVAREEDVALAGKVMVKAEKGCLVANSMLTQIRVEPKFVAPVVELAPSSL